MKTWQAILAHLGIGALQAVAGANAQNGTGPLTHPAVQAGAQIALMFLQGMVAQRNSNTDPNGKKLAPLAQGDGFVSSSK